MKSVCEQVKEKNKHQRKKYLHSTITNALNHTPILISECVKYYLMTDLLVWNLHTPPLLPPHPEIKKKEVTFQLSLGFLKLIQLIILLKRHH